MPLYLSQYGRCQGAVAAVNAMKWLGYPATENDLRSLYDMPKSKAAANGQLLPISVYRAIDKLCTDYGVNPNAFYPVMNMRLGWLAECLQEGWGVILFYRCRDEKGQRNSTYTFFTGISRNEQRFYYVGGRRSSISRSRLRKAFHAYSDGVPCGWIVRPVQQVKRPRYLGQRDGYSCGPIGLINGFKWFGCPITGKELAVLKDLCETRKNNGTYRNFMERGIRHCCHNFGIPRRFVRRLKSPIWQELERELRQNNGVLLEADWRRTPDAHYFLCAWRCRHTDFFEVVNYARTTYPWTFMLREELGQDIKQLRGGWVFDHKAALLT